MIIVFACKINLFVERFVMFFFCVLSRDNALVNTIFVFVDDARIFVLPQMLEGFEGKNVRGREIVYVTFSQYLFSLEVRKISKGNIFKISLLLEVL